MSARRLASLLIVVSACGTDAPVGEPAWFPSNYRATYQEVRSCGLSLEHSAYMRILVSADGVEAFGRVTPFPEGAIVLKEQYAQGDVACAKPLKAYTVMRKLPAGSSPASLDWEWQEVGPNLRERETEIESCIGCHDRCGKAPVGHDGTCSEL